MRKGASRNLFRRIEAAHEQMVSVVLAALPSGEDEPAPVERVIVMAAPLTATIGERSAA